MVDNKCIQFIHSLIKANSETYGISTSNPSERVSCNHEKKIKSIMSNNPKLVKQCSTISPSLPYLYGLIKTHKSGNPIRPIIRSVGSVTYKLSKWLVKVLSPIVGTIPTSKYKT